MVIENIIFFFFFISGDGLIQEKELQHVMRACMDENGMKFDEGEVDELTRALFHDATVVSSNANSGGITFDALKAQLTKHDGLLQNLSISIGNKHHLFWITYPTTMCYPKENIHVFLKNLPSTFDDDF